MCDGVSRRQPRVGGAELLYLWSFRGYPQRNVGIPAGIIKRLLQMPAFAGLTSTRPVTHACSLRSLGMARCVLPSRERRAPARRGRGTGCCLLIFLPAFAAGAGVVFD